MFATIRRSLAALRSPLRIGVVAVLVIAFALLFVNLSLARQRPPSSPAADVATPTLPAATATATPKPTATAIVPLSGPTPTPEVRAPGPPQTKTSGTAPLHVVAASAQVISSFQTLPRDPETCFDNTYGPYDPPVAHAQPVSLYASVFFSPDSAEGDVVFRWHLSSGRVTAPETINWRSPRYNTSIPGATQPSDIPFDATQADGSQMSAQLEVLSPDHLLAEPISFYAPKCEFRLWAVQASGGGIYDCSPDSPDVQTFTMTGTITVTPSPSGSVSYHWERTDGTSTTVTTVATAPGQHTVTATDTITLTRAVPPPAGNAVYDKFVVTAPTDPNINPDGPPMVMVYKGCI